MKKRMLDKATSGVPGLDEIADGGLPKNSIISVSGDVGTGKTILGMQFLHHGIAEAEENGMYICFEEPKKLMYRNMLKFGWNLKALEDAQKLTYLAYPAHEVDLFFEQQDTLINLVDKFAVSRVVIDTASVLGMHFNDDRGRKEGMLKLIDGLRNWGCTTLLINQMHDFPEIGKTTEALSDCVIYLYNELGKGVRRRGIEIYEMRGSRHSMQVHPFIIGSKGIEVDPNGVLEIDGGMHI